MSYLLSSTLLALPGSMAGGHLIGIFNEVPWVRELSHLSR